MSHSVAQHLALSPSTYDAEIRRFIPGYDTMLEEAVAAVAEHVRPRAHLIDLGAGTGSLSERIATRLPEARLTLLDADAAMLKQAETRLAATRACVTFKLGSFTAPLPSCDGAVAAFSLHHVHDAIDKRALYCNIADAIAPGGVLVVADAMLPERGPLAEPLRRRWAAHLVGSGETEEQAYARFSDWALEDRYFSVDDEIAAIKAAGFAAVDVRWRLGPMAVVLAIR
jgi:ubiquinone/menaquinone biosynthesis C-methylase UbiE